jgi:hypothetical protein
MKQKSFGAPPIYFLYLNKRPENFRLAGSRDELYNVASSAAY